jgi:putative DNA methylase
MTYKQKLIEVALPLEDINREAAREKSIRHGHPSTLHLWWARRPLAACRAVLFASMVDDPSECVAELLADAGKRRAAEKVLTAQRKVWEARRAMFDKAVTAGVPSASGFFTGSDLSAESLAKAEPKLEEILIETERERLFDIIRELVVWKNSNDERVLHNARYEIARSVAPAGVTPPTKPGELLEFLAKHAPPVYDPFCGGGSIPLEAQRLGLEAHASDLNPVPVLITKALIEIPPKFAGKPPVNPEARSRIGAADSWKGATGLAEDIRYYGRWMRVQAEKRIGHLYPKVKVVQERDGSYRYATPEEIQSAIRNPNSAIQELTVIAWLWARTVASPNPAAKVAHVPLVRSFWLSTKPGKKAWVEPIVDQSTMTYRFEVRKGGGEPRESTVGRNGGVCLLTGSPIPLDYIRAEGKAGRLSSRLMAIVADGMGGRTYVAPSEEHEGVARSAQPHDVPDTDLPEKALGFRVQNYGMMKHRHLFTDRQLAALTMFCDLVGEIRVKVMNDSGGDQPAYADAVATYLGLAVGRLSDICNALCRWEVSKTQVRNLFTRQAIAMLWDFAEPNVFSQTAGDYSISLSNLIRALEHLPARGECIIKQLNAETLMNDQLRIFSTDPPYYDNVPYADLSDFFYVWLRRCLQPVYPQLLGTMLVPKAEELIAEPFRHGGREKARLFFEHGMGRVFERMRSVSDPRFPTTIYYAFKQAEDEDDGDHDDKEVGGLRASTGWETFLQGLADAGWQIDGTWPMRTELGNRMRNLDSNALVSSIVLVCRPRPKDAGVASRRDFLAALKRELPEALRNLQKGNIAPVDLAQAAIGPGMAVFSRYAKVLETDGSSMGVRTALAIINQSLDEVLAEQEGDFDADTRWALAWFDQYGFNEGPYGAAETLCTAKNTSVSGMTEAGILAARSGKVRLLKKQELPAEWDPATDPRLTIWEATHHLLRALDQGEQTAAGLLRRLGPIAETARELSYRLYTVCERRKWSQDAIAYNTLVLAWPDLTRLAQEQKAEKLVQGELI